MSFIPGFHFCPPAEKLKPEWCDKVMNYYWYQTRKFNLLEGKNVLEIDGYADGNYSLKPFRSMFRSERRKMLAENDVNMSTDQIRAMDTIGLQMTRVGMIAPKLNSGIATQQKIPLEITATCLDALAQKKKEEDLDFLKAKKEMEEVLQPLYDSMNLGKVDVGATQHSSIPFTGMPMDLDIQDEEEFRMFANMIYNLAPESAIETILKSFSDVLKLVQIKRLNIRDQYKYAVSTLRGFSDKNTDLPNVEYLHPGTMWTDGSSLPDFSDNIFRVVEHRVTPMELFKYFPDEICDEAFLEKIVNFSGTRGQWGNGYTACNNYSRQDRKYWDTYRMTMLEVEVKSVDNVMVSTKPKTTFKYFTNEETKCTGRVWGQNTYTFFWLVNTKWFFGIDRLGFAYRSKGKEIYTGFSTIINKTQEVSAVEHCIGENIKAQMADIKLQFEIIMSSPPGKVIDLKYIRNVIDGLADESDKYTMKELIDKANESNIHIIDSEGFENKQQGAQYLPVRELPGGLKDSILGYYKVRFEAERNISSYLSINDQLTGQSAAPDALVGTQKLLLSASINGLYYVTEAIQQQYQALFNIWTYHIQKAIKKGGAAKKAIENIIGSRKVEILRGLDDIPLHQIGIVITLNQREEERAHNEQELQRLRQAGVLNAADIYEIRATDNPRDAAWLIAVKENRFQKKQERARREGLAAQQKLAETQGQNMLQNTQAQTQGNIEEIGAETKGEAQLMLLADKLQLGQEYTKGLLKRKLQSDRIQGQTEKSLKTIDANKNAKLQEAFQ